MNDRIVFEDVSKFYGEVLGVNRVSLSIPPGITTLVGPNGAGKTTVMNLMTGLIQLPPTRWNSSAPSATARSSISFPAALPAGNSFSTA